MAEKKPSERKRSMQPKGTKSGKTTIVDEYGLSQYDNEVLAEYLSNGQNASAAIRKCHPTAAGWTIGAVNTEAKYFFARPQIRLRAAVLLSEQAKRLALTDDKVLTEAARIAFSDVRKLFDAEGNLLHPSMWPDDVAASVASVEMQLDRVTQDTDTEEFDGDGKLIARRRVTTVLRQETHTKKIKFWDKNQALEKLFKHKGLFREDNAQRNQFTPDLAALPLPVVQLIQARLREITGTQLPEAG